MPNSTGDSLVARSLWICGRRHINKCPRSIYIYIEATAYLGLTPRVSAKLGLENRNGNLENNCF